VVFSLAVKAKGRTVSQEERETISEVMGYKWTNENEAVPASWAARSHRFSWDMLKKTCKMLWINIQVGLMERWPKVVTKLVTKLSIYLKLFNRRLRKHYYLLHLASLSEYCRR